MQELAIAEYMLPDNLSVFMQMADRRPWCVCFQWERGQVVDIVKKQWAESDFSMSSEDLLQLLPRVLCELGVKPNR
jgi:hypothetical protein